MTGSNGGVGTEVVGTSGDGGGDGDGIIVAGICVVVNSDSVVMTQ